MRHVKYFLFILISFNTFASVDTLFIDDATTSPDPSFWWEVSKVIGNKIYSNELLEQGRDSLLRCCKNDGYLFATATFDTVGQENCWRTKYYVHRKYLRARYNLISGPKFTVNKIRFVGNHYFSERRLKSNFNIKEKRLFRSGILNFDTYKPNLDSLLHFYYEKGFAAAKIISDSISYDTANHFIFITINIHEGIKYRVGNISFSGDTLFGYNTLRPFYWIRTSEKYNQNTFDEGRDSTIALFHNNGYANVIVTHDIFKHNDTCDINISINSGNKIFVNKIIIEGNTYTKEKVFRRNVLLIPGQIYVPELVKKSIENIYSNFTKESGYYFYIVPQVINKKDNTVDIVFRIEDEGRF